MHNTRLTGSLALSIAYGVQVDTLDDEILRLFNDAKEISNEVLVPGAFLVDIIPLRKSSHLNANYRQDVTCCSQVPTSLVPRCTIPCVCEKA